MKFKIGDRVRGKVDNGYYVTDETSICRVVDFLEEINEDGDDILIEVLEVGEYMESYIGVKFPVNSSKFELESDFATIVEEPANELAYPQVEQSFTVRLDPSLGYDIRLTRGEAEQLHKKLGELL